MHHPFRRLYGLVLLTLAVAVSLPGAPADRTFETSPTLRIEIRTLIRLLDEVHYNRDHVKPANYGDVLPDFMDGLDGQHLFFLDSDKQGFLQRYDAQTLYVNVNNLGNIDAAYEIFKVYETRVSDRVAWIDAELKKDIDLDGHDSYLFDRTKAAWPADAATADELWHRRLKFELLQEILSKKTPAAAPATGSPATPGPEKVAATTPKRSPMDEARETIAKRYQRMLKNLDETEATDLSEMFLSSIARLYDPHSTYFSASTYEDFGIQMRLQLVGIGALLGLEDDQCVVKEIIPGGPADLSKLLKPDDKIIAVSQDDTEPVEVIGMKLRKIVDMIRGAKNTHVHLLIEPGATAATATRKEIVLTRDIVNIESARAHAAVFDVPAAGGATTRLGVITLPLFYGPDASTQGDQNSTSKDIAELIKRLQTEHVQGIVLDLRNNGGGLLSEAIALTGLFIRNGPVVQVRSYFGDVKVDSDDDSALAYSGPLAVLVNRFSASASEIVAGALQNYGRAVIIGDTSTHGKGTVQTIIEMKNVVQQLASTPIKTGATKLTIQKFYLPDGSSTQLKGVVPDLILPSIDEYLPVGESALPHALAWDKIDSTHFDGHPLAATVLAPLRVASDARLGQLDEFAYLKQNISWFKAKQDQKSLSLNLADREKQKADDAAFKKAMDIRLKVLEKNSYPFTEVMLAPPPPPRIKSTKPSDDPDADPMELSTDENERYSKMDIPLREALRVVQDTLTLKPEPPQWLIAATPAAPAGVGPAPAVKPAATP